MDLTDTSMTFAATPPVEGFRFLLSRAMTGGNPQGELVVAFFDISRAHFHSPVRRKVAIMMLGDPSCPSGIAMHNRAMYGTEDAAQCFDSYCELTMEKLTTTLECSDTVMIATLATRTQIAEFKGHLSKHSLVKHTATLGPRPQLLDACKVRFLNRVIHCVAPPFGKAPEPIEIEADPRHLESVRETVHARSNFHHKIPHHNVPMSCDSRSYQLIELNCCLPVKN